MLFNFQLAPCSSLCYLFQESSFLELDLFECLPTCWTMCFKLTEDVKEFDSKVQMLNFISVLIEHVGDKVIPFASQSSQIFQKSPLSYHMVIPILQSSRNVDSPDALNLLEDSVLESKTSYGLNLFHIKNSSFGATTGLNWVSVQVYFGHHEPCCHYSDKLKFFRKL